MQTVEQALIAFNCLRLTQKTQQKKKKDTYGRNIEFDRIKGEAKMRKKKKKQGKAQKDTHAHTHTKKKKKKSKQ